MVLRKLNLMTELATMTNEEWDPAIVAALFAEVTRVVGNERAVKGGENIAYGPPLSMPERLLTLLRGAPSEVGIEGFWRHLEEQFPEIRESREKMG